MHKGFVGLPIIIAIAVIAVLGGAGYVAYQANTEATVETGADASAHTEENGAHEHSEGDAASVSGKIGIAWKFVDKGEDAYGTPRTEVTAVVSGTPYVIGTFDGSCTEIGAEGGVDGTGLLAGELSAAQCWFAGGGDEIGLFAHEDGGYQILVGALGEPDGEGAPGFRGDFDIKVDLAP